MERTAAANAPIHDPQQTNTLTLAAFLKPAADGPTAAAAAQRPLYCRVEPAATQLFERLLWCCLLCPQALSEIPIASVGAKLRGYLRFTLAAFHNENSTAEDLRDAAVRGSRLEGKALRNGTPESVVLALQQALQALLSGVDVDAAAAHVDLLPVCCRGVRRRCVMRARWDVRAARSRAAAAPPLQRLSCPGPTLAAARRAAVSLQQRRVMPCAACERHRLPDAADAAPLRADPNHQARAQPACLGLAVPGPAPPQPRPRHGRGLHRPRQRAARGEPAAEDRRAETPRGGGLHGDPQCAPRPPPRPLL